MMYAFLWVLIAWGCIVFVLVRSMNTSHPQTPHVRQAAPPETDADSPTSKKLTMTQAEALALNIHGPFCPRCQRLCGYTGPCPNGCDDPSKDPSVDRVTLSTGMVIERRTTHWGMVYISRQGAMEVIYDWRALAETGEDFEKLKALATHLP